MRTTKNVMRHPRAPGGSNAEEIVRHSRERERLDKEPANNKVRREAGSMPTKKLPSCEFRVVTPAGQLNICRAGLYGGKVTDGMCRLCIERGDKPPTIISLPRVAVGDAVERILTSLGITKERVQKWLQTEDCGCKKRKGWLNEWGYEKQDQLERVLNKAARWYGIS